MHRGSVARAGADVSPRGVALARACAILGFGAGVAAGPIRGCVSVSCDGAFRARDSAQMRLGEHPPFRLYLDRGDSAMRALAALRSHHAWRAARLVARIADVPTAVWFSTPVSAVAESVREVVTTASGRGEVPVLVTYFRPRSLCGAGIHGARSASEFVAWARQFSAGLSGHRAIVVVEPDAVPAMVDGCGQSGRLRGRLQILRDVVVEVGRDRAARLYVDAGNPGWVQDVTRLADALRQAGVGPRVGFALNVANFQTTAASEQYGATLSRLLGGAHFVVDTGRNGNGPDMNPADAPTWCNPPGRALGVHPTLATGDLKVDAFLWIKPPGESDGACRPGAPASGEWWLAYAEQLAGDTCRDCVVSPSRVVGRRAEGAER